MIGSISVLSGKWYWEIALVSGVGNGFGIIGNDLHTQGSATNWAGNWASAYIYYESNGQIYYWSIKVLYKTLRTDSAENFNDIEWSFFNTTGIPDSTVPISKTRNDFKEYRYFAGKNSLGVGTELNEFVAFAVKIVLQGSNTSLPPLVKDFRAIAFQA